MYIYIIVCSVQYAHKCGHSTSYIWWLWWRGISPWLRIRAGGATSISMTPVDVIRPKQDVLGKSAGCKVMFRCFWASSRTWSSQLFLFSICFFVAGLAGFPIFLAQCLIYIGDYWWNAYFTGSMPMLLSLVQCRSACCCDVLMPSLCFHVSSSRWRGAAPFHGGRRQHP